MLPCCNCRKVTVDGFEASSGLRRACSRLCIRFAPFRVFPIFTIATKIARPSGFHDHVPSVRDPLMAARRPGLVLVSRRATVP